MYKFEGQKQNFFVYVDRPCGEVYGPYGEELESWQQGGRGTKHSFEAEAEAKWYCHKMKEYFNSI